MCVHQSVLHPSICIRFLPQSCELLSKGCEKSCYFLLTFLECIVTMDTTLLLSNICTNKTLLQSCSLFLLYFVLKNLTFSVLYVQFIRLSHIHCCLKGVTLQTK